MSRCKGTWKKCNNVESDVYHAVFVNENCPHGVDNGKGDYFVYKSKCDSCEAMQLKEESETKT